MPILDPLYMKLAVALGIGLLVGAERERRKSRGPSRSPAGIRTFAAMSLAGAISFSIGGETLLAVTTAGAIILTAVAYSRSRSDDPGLTSEIALILTTLLGGLSIREPAVAAGVAVVLTALLAARELMHHFVRSVLTEREVTDGLIFAGATLVALPLLPNQPMGPYGALNPQSIWIIVILVMAISAAGYILVRILGDRFGLALAGLASGFISSIATIGAMGTRSKITPAVLGAAVAGAVLSTVATILQMCAVLAATSLAVLRELSIPLFCAGLMAVSYAAYFTIKVLHGTQGIESRAGRAFSFSSAIILAATLSGILVISASLRETFGEIGAIVGAALAGFADTHSAAVSIASIVAAGKMTPADAISPILTALSTNTVSKIIISWTSGGGSYAFRLVPGLLLVISAAWAGAYIPHLLGP